MQHNTAPVQHNTALCSIIQPCALQPCAPRSILSIGAGSPCHRMSQGAQLSAPVQHNTAPVQHNTAPVQHNTAPVEQNTASVRHNRHAGPGSPPCSMLQVALLNPYMIYQRWYDETLRSAKSRPRDHQNQHMFYAHCQCEAIRSTKCQSTTRDRLNHQFFPDIHSSSYRVLEGSAAEAAACKFVSRGESTSCLKAKEYMF